jgi:hypothetical protein
MTFELLWMFPTLGTYASQKFSDAQVDSVNLVLPRLPSLNDDDEAREQAPSMARKLRMEYPGAIYHILNRGARREAIFRDDQDRNRFIGTLGEACQKTSWEGARR